MFYLYDLQDFVMKCECGNIARVGWPGMTCVCCESPRSGGSLEWGGLVGLRAGEPPGKSPLPFPQQLPRLLLYLPLLPLILFDISSCNFLQNSFLWLLSIWEVFFPLLHLHHLHLEQLVILLLRICTEKEGGFVIISIKK